MKDEIYVAKLVSSETVIGEFHRTGEYLFNTYLIMMMPQGNGQMGVSLAPYMMPFEKEGSEIDAKFIISKTKAPKELEDAYIQASTGIIISKNKLTF